MLAMIMAAAAIVAPPANAVTHAAADAAGPVAIAGRWITETRHGIVDIAPCGGSICGHLIDSDRIRADPHTRDDHNRDAALRQRPLKNLPLLQGFSNHGSQWDGGSVYNPDDGGTYHGTLIMIDGDTLKVRGCIVWPLCKSQVWKRSK